MTTIHQDIEVGFYAGNTKTLKDTITDALGAAKDLTSAEVTFAIFDANGNVYAQKSSSDSNEISIPSPTNGICYIYLKPLDTLNLSGDYTYHVNVVDTNGNEETVTTGTIKIFRSYARRFRHSGLPAYMTGA